MGSGSFLMLKINDYLPAKYNKNQAKLPGELNAHSNMKQQASNNTAQVPPKNPNPPNNNSQPAGQQPITKTKKKRPFSTVASLAIIGLFVVATAVGFYLMQNNQDTRQQAYLIITPTPTPTPTPNDGCSNAFAVNNSTKCLVNTSYTETLQAWVWTCPNMTWAEAGAGWPARSG